jgi:hypothetical protein
MRAGQHLRQHPVDRVAVVELEIAAAEWGGNGTTPAVVTVVDRSSTDPVRLCCAMSDLSRTLRPGLATNDGPRLIKMSHLCNSAASSSHEEQLCHTGSGAS